MAVRMNKAWRALEPEAIAALPGHLGVFQLGDDDGNIVLIGCADARTKFGLRGELQDILAAPPPLATQFRIESTMAYRTRHLELLQVYVHDHGTLPSANTGIDITRLGVIGPS
jgi:hypothetical protein